jgi:hypothetical protein
MLKGGAGDDRLYGGPSADSFWPGSGDDVVRGGGTGSREWVHYENAPRPMRIDLDSGSANGFGTDLLFAVLDVSGSRFGDVIKGNKASNVLRLGPGNDHGVGRAGVTSCSAGPARTTWAGRTRTRTTGETGTTTASTLIQSPARGTANPQRS